MYEYQTQDFKYENERLAHELQNIKKKYLSQKHKEQQSRSGFDPVAPPQSHSGGAVTCAD